MDDRRDYRQYHTRTSVNKHPYVRRRVTNIFVVVVNAQSVRTVASLSTLE